MRIYRFRVLIDHPSEAFRDIEIGSEQNFLDLHKAIKDAIDFIGQEMACFYVSDEEWGKGPEIPLADLGFAEEGHVPALMDQVFISDHIRGTDQHGQQIKRQIIDWVEWDGDVEHLPKEGSDVHVLLNPSIVSGWIKLVTKENKVSAFIANNGLRGDIDRRKGDMFAVVE